jgi:PAS domain S-box-containing protein
MRTGTSLFVARMTDAFQLASQDPEHLEVLRDLGAISVIVAPLRAGGVVHGVMTFATTSASGRHFVRDDLDLAEQLARRAALAIQNARLYRDAHAAEARYRGLFEGTMDGIIVVAPDGSCVDANPAMCAMIGYDRDELIGRPSPLAACGGPWTGEAGEQLRHEGRWWGEFELPRRDRPPVPVESWITAVQLSTGPVYVGVVRDVSERRRFERMQEEFLSALAHDLKNPLTAVHGQTQLLQRRLTRGQLPDAARLADRLEGIDAAVAQMTALLDELTDITRLRAGQEIELRRAPTDLVALARRTIEGQERIAGRHTVAMRTDLSELVGFWDGPRLERVLSNLLGNAIKYSPRGGPITVAIAREDADGAAAAVLSVTDQGVGIPASDLDLIFERYRRAGNVESFAGSGIGLSGAKRIVELHGGTIAVTSTEGVGSTFTVRIPIEGNARP